MKNIIPQMLYVVILLVSICSLCYFLDKKLEPTKRKKAELSCELGMNLYKLQITKYKGNIKKSDSAYNSDIVKILDEIYK